MAGQVLLLLLVNQPNYLFYYHQNFQLPNSRPLGVEMNYNSPSKMIVF